MEIVWPSAGRAWELLEDAKKGLAESRSGGQRDDWPKPNDPAEASRKSRKRSAGDTFGLDDHDDMSFGYLPPTNSATPSYPSAISTPVDYVAPGDIPNTNAGSGSATDSLSFIPSYERWTNDPSMGFPMGLSTSVLPQSFSTGYPSYGGATSGSSRGLSSINTTPSLTGHGPRSSAAMGPTYNPGMSGQGIGQHAAAPAGTARQPSTLEQQGRYSQFWNDYTVNLGQPSSMLGSMFGMGIIGGNQPPPSHAQGPGGHPQQQQQHQGNNSMYMGNGFGGLFSESFSPHYLHRC